MQQQQFSLHRVRSSVGTRVQVLIHVCVVGIGI